MRSVKSVAILASLFSAAAAQAAPIFFESFENGNGAWTAADGNDITITADTEICSTSYQHEIVPYSGGRVSTNDPIAVTGGNTYCVSAFVRASSDALPFLGINTATVDGPDAGTHWLMGYQGYPSGYGDYAVVIATDDAWHWYGATVTLDASTVSFGITYELTASGYADFDDIAVTAGPCATEFMGADPHQACFGDTPVCSADGSCQPVATPPGDMGGPSSSPDMGGAPSTSNNQGFTPSTPVAAEGTPSGSGAVTTTSSGGGCSLGGSEGERSFGILMLALVVVIFAGRRRRA